jgi:integrase
MTAAVQTTSRFGTADDDADVVELWSMIDPSFLHLLSWDDERQVITFPMEHPLLGWHACLVTDCDKDSRQSSHRLCQACLLRWRQAEGTPLDEFVLVEKPRRRAIEVSTCAVTGCRRPWKSAKLLLCVAHEWQRQQDLQLPLAEFLARNDIVGLPSFGPCTVASCTRDRVGKGPYCHSHQARFRAAQNPDLNVEHWNLTTPAVAENADVSLRGLHPRVVAELIYGLQQRTASGAKTRYWNFRPLCDRVRILQAGSLIKVSADLVGRNAQKALSVFLREIRKFEADPEIERYKDIWDLVAFGHAGTLNFTGISQPWLRDATRRWALHDLPKRRGQQVGNSVQTKVNSIGLLSESLRRQRQDQGALPSALSRHDITMFCNRLAYLADQGSLSIYQRVKSSREVRHLLSAMRDLNLTRPGEPLHGLPDDFRLTADDIPDEPDDTQAGRDLPLEVMRHLCEHLPALDDTYVREIRVAIELLVDTGRRPREICSLDLDCLDRDSDGKPVLIYDNHKENRKGRQLPIPAATAALIVVQQEAVRARFPGAPDSELKLLASHTRNPRGARAITENWVGKRHRDWVDSLLDVAVPMAVEEHGKQVTKMLPFDKSKIFPYAYRHTYAQRHADAGVDVTVLKELMDHRQLSTTQGYYNVGQERRREAVERVITMQFDRHGNRVWRQAKALLDSEHARRAIGEVAVPYGGCTEPSNVAADGQDCPLRFRCIGCGHFTAPTSPTCPTVRRRWG